MIMSEKERNEFSEGTAVFFPENHLFEVTSGKTYNLNDIYDKAEWEAKFQQRPFVREGLLLPLDELRYFNGILPDCNALLHHNAS